MEFTGKFLEFDKQNGNGRIYPRELAFSIVNQFNDMSKKEPMYGTIMSNLSNQFGISLDHITHQIKEINYNPENNCIEGTIEILDTPDGKMIQQLMDLSDEKRISIASRGYGNVDENGVVLDFNLSSFDIVDAPAFKETVLSPKEEKTVNLDNLHEKWNPKEEI